ncbi:hypothetical protein OF83DRAFT_1230224, partial [Amylostereum chailletii]
MKAPWQGGYRHTRYKARYISPAVAVSTAVRGFHLQAGALQLHPNRPAFYILAVPHELKHLAPSAPHTLLQRGIRLNGESVATWREYVRMEASKTPEVGGEGGLAALDKMAVESEEEEGEEEVGGEATSKETEEELGEGVQWAIMNGAIIKVVISSTFK